MSSGRKLREDGNEQDGAGHNPRSSNVVETAAMIPTAWILMRLCTQPGQQNERCTSGVIYYVGSPWTRCREHVPKLKGSPHDRICWKIPIRQPHFVIRLFLQDIHVFNRPFLSN